MFRRAAALAVVGLLVSGGAALAAARITSTTGTVMVSKNGQLVPATPGMVLNAGDRVIASKGSAKVAYDDGCDVKVDTRSMETIAPASPCAGGTRTTTKVASETGRPFFAASERDFWLWLGYGAITVTAVGIALDNDEQPVSP